MRKILNRREKKKKNKWKKEEGKRKNKLIKKKRKELVTLTPYMCTVEGKKRERKAEKKVTNQLKTSNPSSEQNQEKHLYYFF